MYISLTIFTLYTIYVLIKFKTPQSYSQTYYKLKHKIVFIIFTWGVALPLHITQQNIYMSLSAFGLIIVGCASAFKANKATKITHWIGAIMAALFSQLYMFDSFYLAMLAIMAFAALLTKNKLFWIEFSLFILLYLKLYLVQ